MRQETGGSEHIRVWCKGSDGGTDKYDYGAISGL